MASDPQSRSSVPLVSRIVASLGSGIGGGTGAGVAFTVAYALTLYPPVVTHVWVGPLAGIGHALLVSISSLDFGTYMLGRLPAMVCGGVGAWCGSVVGYRLTQRRTVDTRASR